MKKRTKRTLAMSGKVLLRVVLASVLCAIMYLSMMFIATAMFSEVIGYQIHEMTEDDKIILVEEHKYAVGEKHVTKEELDITDDQAFTELREVPAKTLAIFNVLAQIMMLIVLAIFPYHVMWEFGNKDDTKVRYKGQRPDPYRGFRVGAFAMIPFLLLWGCLVLAKYGILPEGYAQVYRVATISFLPYVSWMMPAASLQNTTVGQLLLLLPMLLFIPVVCGVSYRMGHTQYSIREHLVFAKKHEENDEEI